MQDNINMLDNVLQDKSATGKERPWRDKKLQNTLLAMAYDTIDPSKATRLRSCADVLTFVQALTGGKRILKSANFCRVRLCPVCTWRRSLKVYAQMDRIIGAVKEPMSYVFLTLTVRNCVGADLSATLDKLISAYKLMTLYVDFKAAVKGWYRGVEVTHNLTEDTYHPHMHVLIAVNPSYFTDTKIYLSHKRWTAMWQKALKVDYVPIVNVKRCHGNTASAIAEVAKYPLKDGDYLVPDDWDLTLDTVQLLDKALANRRFIAFGGLFKVLHKQLNLDDAEDGDMVHVESDDTVSDDGYVSTYMWAQGYNQYILH